MSKRAGCICGKCRELCRNEAGWFMPGEAEATAAFLGVSLREFVRDYLDEHHEGGAAVLSPRMIGGACIFFKNGLCGIHPAKPYECRKVFGCEGVRRHKRIREIIAKRWKR